MKERSDRRHPTVDGDIAYVPLTRGQVAIIDAADVPLIAGRNWFLSLGYAASVAFKNNRWTTEKMHRVIVGAPVGMDIDHINMHTLDNRRANLRVCTRTMNLANKRVRRDSASGVKGVDLHPDTGRYRARIKVNGRQIHIGYFATIEEAVAAYAVQATEVFGTFARTD